MKKKILTVIAAAMAMAAMLAGCGTNYTVKLTDTNPVKVELGTELSTDVRDYITVMEGDEAISDGEVFEDIVLDTANIDINTTGTYTLVITYKDNQLVIPVIVEDTIAPEILVEDITVAAGEEITVDKYVSVSDLQEVTTMFVLSDGSRTDKFTFDGTPVDVTVEAVDASGNKAEAVMKVNLLDTKAPVITVEDVTITVGDKFDPMANVTAVDDVDGDVADRIVITGEADTEKEGTYTLTYTVKDAAGNEASAERTVTVVKKSTPKKGGNSGNGTTGSAGSTGNAAGGNTTAPAGSTGNAQAPAPTPDAPAAGGNTGSTGSGGNSSTPPAQMDPIQLHPDIQDIIDKGGSTQEIWDSVDWDNPEII